MMSKWETTGESDEWYTPKYIFDALGCEFDTDVASPLIKTHVPAKEFITQNSLRRTWNGFVWCNPPFGGRNGIIPWLDKIYANGYGNGIALTPDRTSCPWWQKAARQADLILFIDGKVKFIKPDGSEGKSPSTGTTLFAYGYKAKKALYQAETNGLGIVMFPRLKR